MQSHFTDKLTHMHKFHSSKETERGSELGSLNYDHVHYPVQLLTSLKCPLQRLSTEWLM